MPEKERVDFSLPEGMDPDTLVPIPLHCISDIFAWMAYTRVIHPQSAFAEDIKTIRQAVWDMRKDEDKVDEISTRMDIEVGDTFIAVKANFIFQYPVDRGDILEIEKIDNAEENMDAKIIVNLRRHSTFVTVKKSYLTELVRDGCLLHSGPLPQ